MARTRRTGVVAALLLALAAATAGVVAPAAQAAETWAWPASGTLTVYGHGYGHGHGMSQHGAYGAATKGLTYPQIIAFYYKGTTLGTVTDPSLRVLVTADTDNATQVGPLAGLTVHTADGAATLPAAPAGTTATGWRVVRNAGGLQLQYTTGSTWTAYAVGSKYDHAGEVSFTAAGGQVRLVLGSTYRAYRGTVVAVPTSTSPTVRTVVATTMADYLKSVVPSEMPSSWSAAALQAQAVAARTYASYDRAHKPAGRYYDTCDSTSCQVFKGAADYNAAGTLVTTHEATSSTTAVTSTVNRVVLYSGALAFTQFSSSNGGWAAAGSQPYLAAFADPYDGVVPSTAHSWTTTLSASTLQSAYPSIGTLRSVTLSRDGHGEWGGRVTSITLTGSSGSTTVTGDSFRSATGMRSTWWAPASTGWSAYDLVVAPGDWNHDGRPDLIARKPDGTLWLTPGIADGTAPATSLGAGWAGLNPIVGAGDLTGDGHPDLVARRYDGTLWIYPGTGYGAFLARRSLGAGWGGYTAIVGAGDWTGDGRADLMTRASNGTLYLWPGNGAGGFSARRSLGTGWASLTALFGAGDLTGDRHPDLVGRRSDASLVVYPGNGSGGFLAFRNLGTGWGGFDTLLGPGDWNRDGKADLVGRVSGNLWLYFGNGAGGFSSREQIGAP